MISSSVNGRLNSRAFFSSRDSRGSMFFSVFLPKNKISVQFLNEITEAIARLHKSILQQTSNFTLTNSNLTFNQTKKIFLLANFQQRANV